MSATARQIGMIHALAGRAGMDEDTRRDFLARETGKRSTKEISIAQAASVIDKLKPLARPAGSVAGLDSAIGGKLRALWIAGYDLGLVRDRSDKALLAFIERQTGLSHPNFAREPSAMMPAVEALKAWIARERGVSWPARDADVNLKLIVVTAQWRKLGSLGALTAYDPQNVLTGLDAYASRVSGGKGVQQMGASDFDTLQRVLGTKLRKALAARASDPAEASEP